MVLLYNRSRLGAVERAALTAAAHLSLSCTQSHRTNLFFCLSSWPPILHLTRLIISIASVEAQIGPPPTSQSAVAAPHLCLLFSRPSAPLLDTSASLFLVHLRCCSSPPRPFFSSIPAVAPRNRTNRELAGEIVILFIVQINLLHAILLILVQWSMNKNSTRANEIKGSQTLCLSSAKSALTRQYRY